MASHSRPLNSNTFSSFTKRWQNNLRLMRDHTNSFATTNLPSTTFDHVDFVKNLQPKFSEFPKTIPKSKIRINLSSIRDAIVSEVQEDMNGILVFHEGSKCNEDQQHRGSMDWEPIPSFQKLLKKNVEFLDNLKSSFKSMCKEPEDSKEVHPLDASELFVYFIRQSAPFLDQLGVKRDICDKIVESLYSRRKNQRLLHSFSGEESYVLQNSNINDELDLRIASVLQSTGHHYDGGFWTDHAKRDPSDDQRHVAIVTTSSLPWMTGTSVNPVFRAAYLSKSSKQKVTLLIPWLCRSDQEEVYPNNITFSSPEEQQVYIRNWLEERIGFEPEFKISFYPAKFSKKRRSIIAAGDTSKFIPNREADIAILEEPEHLNWYHHGKRWTKKFNHVVGIVHTNYLEYIKREKNGDLQAFFVKHVNNWVTKAYCHKVLRLSAATQDFPKSEICNVHGVSPKFLRIGEKIDADRELGQKPFTKGAYFLGKMVWAKGYKELIYLLAKHKNDLDGFKIDVFGSGEDANEVQSTAKTMDLNINFQKGRDHAEDSLHGYKVFINPSVSDVICTATAEALAMGQFVVCADHPSNEFFMSFPNCLTYRTSEDFVAKVKEALENEPRLLTPEQRYQLSWEAATQRFMEYSDLDRVMNNEKGMTKSNQNTGKLIASSPPVPSLTEFLDGGLAFAHYCLTGNEFLRLCTGAIPGTRYYNKQHSEDLRLLPPQVENPIYGW